MKAIIIDDETHVREGLLLLAEWKRFGIQKVFEAKDGEEAQNLIIQNQPEIIFTDMNMPNFDGIKLLKWLSKNEIKSKIIVISGYDDFHYMRNAITYGSYDYLLKPIDPGLLNETLERAVSDWKKEALQRESTNETNRVINEVKPLYWDYLFSNIIANQVVSDETVQKIKKEFGVLVNKVECTISLIFISSKIIEKFDNDKDLAFFTLLNISNEIVRSKQSGFCFRNINKENEIVVLLWNSKNEIEILKKIQTEIYKFSGINALFVVGKPLSLIKEAYHSARKTLLKHNMMECSKRNNIVCYEDITTGPNLHLFDFAEDIKWAVQSSSTEQMEEIMQKIFYALESKHVLSYEQVSVWEEQFEILRKNWLKEYNTNEDVAFYKGTNYWDDKGRFSFNKFKEEKRKEFYELIHLLNDVRYKKETNSIQEIEAYLRKNYEKDITLQEIAERFFLSREYISRKFKQEYHETLTNYLTKIRIEKAKELLENPHLKVYEISYKVGYPNEKYFSKVFKKLVGVTPNVYRIHVMSK
ncbi:response regulator transcription factor [Metabacillus halosaccharovorans]|uniref:Response regulator n=1 Tax=Metabacillus halosaccharovorans TaxID=930124 RepID=A0ABT3DEC7_9BACI|nr:response regulator [Metabacillus halosaccharovorans]MCV9885324.1 response regulator [Metabacillus halosaccharovorans]